METWVPLKIIINNASLNAYRKIAEGRRIDSQCLRKLISLVLAEMLGSNGKVAKELANEYDCERNEFLGVDLERLEPINEAGKTIIRLIREAIREEIEKCLKTSLAPLFVTNPKSDEGMKALLEYGLNAFPYAVALSNGPVVKMKMNKKENM